MARIEEVAMIKKIVIDASVITRWYLNEEWTDNALQLRNEYQQGKLFLIAPYLIYYEVANALRYSQEISEEDTIKSLASLLKIQLNLYFLDNQLFEKTIELAFHYNITIYDSSYCAIAKMLGCNFITGDEKLKKKNKSILLYLA